MKARLASACIACCDAGADFDWCRACGRHMPMDVLTEAIIERAAPEPTYPENGWEWTDRHRLDFYLRVIDAVNGEPLAWGTMIYACTKGPRCGFEHRVWMRVGVEGPPALKSAGLTVPAPFYCGHCPGCGGSLAHDRWNQDEEWDVPRPIPPSTAYFRLPSKSEAAQYVRQNYGGADYEDPTGRTTPPRPNRAERRKQT